MSNDRVWLGLILLAYLLLALAYGVVNPLFEAPDEDGHYFTAQYIAEHQRLPRVIERADEWMGQEAAQPPLYYLIAAFIIAPIDLSDARALVWRNPFVHLGDASALTNVNAFVHGPWEAWPWQGYVLAGHLLRVFSSLLGLGTLLFLFSSARYLWPERPGRALLVTAMVAFLPQFVFIHSAISNDTLITVLSAAALWQLLRLFHKGMTRRHLLWLGVTAGLAVLSKMAGLLLLVYLVGALLFYAWRNHALSLRLFGNVGLYVVLPAAVLSGWLLWRNWTLYGDITATNQFIKIAGGDRGYRLLDVLAETPSLWASLFAVFGWFNVRAPNWVYWLWDALVAAALIGVVVGQRAGNEDKMESDRSKVRMFIALLLAGWVLLVYAGLVNFMLRTPAAQGRLLFPALLPLALGFGYGLDRLGQPLRLVPPVLALATTLYCLLFVIAPTYERPPLLLNEAALPDDVERINADFGDGLELVGAALHTPVGKPGDPVWLTLYWQAHKPLPSTPELVLEVLGRNQALVGKVQSYHGAGLYPATLWPEDRIISDRLGVRLQDTLEVPTQLIIQIGLVGQHTRQTVAALKAVPASWSRPHGAVLAQLDQKIQLVEAKIDPARAEPGEELLVSLSWHVLQAPERHLTTFVHLGDPSQPPVASGDSVPLQGDYPTGLWAAGEVVHDDHYTISLPAELPPGRYPIIVGMYDPATGARLPLLVDGQRQVHDAYVAGWVDVGS